MLEVLLFVVTSCPPPPPPPHTHTHPIPTEKTGSESDPSTISVTSVSDSDNQMKYWSALTPSLSWCDLKTTHKSGEFETFKHTRP